jgi:SAM-dependent methyltransferase
METFTNRAEERAFLETQINALTGPLEILEAGCGVRPLIRVSSPHRLIGIDTDANAIEIRRRKFNDLHEVILGDLRTAQFSAGRFDVIYCSFVLEHVDGAEYVLENFVRWLKPGGLIILRVPDRDSVWGFVTRHTPLWVHVYVKRYLMGHRNAGRPGFAPYPVFYDYVISQSGMAQFCEKHRLTMQFVCLSADYLRDSRVVKYVAWLISTLSFGRLPWRHSNVTFVIRKP